MTMTLDIDTWRILSELAFKGGEVCRPTMYDYSTHNIELE